MFDCRSQIPKSEHAASINTCIPSPLPNKAEHQRLGVWVNNAGPNLGGSQNTFEAAENVFHQSFVANFLGVLRMDHMHPRVQRPFRQWRFPLHMLYH